jgi:hypothetical protein
MNEPIIARAYPALSAIEIARAIGLHLSADGVRQPGPINDAIALFCRERFARVDDDIMKEALAIVEFRLRNPASSSMMIEPLRKIEPIDIADLDIVPIEDAKPVIEWIDPKSLWIDPLYQRSISDRGRKLIRTIIEEFSWRKFSPPTCAYATFNGERVLLCTDGQHRAIGAASRPDIDLIPVQIIDASSTAQQAESFVTTNSARLSVAKLQIHQSAIVAGDVDALTIEEIANAVGVQILRTSTPRYQAGDTLAIGSLYSLLSKFGFSKTKTILRTLAKARLAPIDQDHIKACTLLLTDRDYCGSIEPEALSEAILGLSLVDKDEAKQLAASKNMPYWRALAAVWFRRCKKSRASKKVGRAA